MTSQNPDEWLDDYRAMVSYMKAVATSIDLHVERVDCSRGREGWLFYPPGPRPDDNACTRGIGVFESRRGVEINCAVLSDFGRRTLADGLISRLEAMTGLRLRTPKYCTSVRWPEASSLLEDWSLTRREVVQPYLQALAELTVDTPPVEDQGAIEHLVRGRLTGQGFANSAARSSAVELRAIEIAEQHYRGLDWSVKNVSAHESYDLLCKKGRKVCHVEVKGTSGAGAEWKVLLTANEVRLAQRNPKESELAVVKEIIVRPISNGGWLASGGTLGIISPWDPNSADLEPITYRLTASWSGNEAEQ